MVREMIEIERLSEHDFLQNLDIHSAILYYIDRVEVVDNIKSINLKNIIEGRYFGYENEIRVFKSNGTLKAVLNKEEKDYFIKTAHLVEKKFGDIKKVEIKKYVDTDDDGQAYVSYWRPSKLIREV